MAATSIQLAPSHASDASFRAYCQAIHDILQSGGWVQISDTGQIDLTTVLTPSAGGQVRGYEIWRSNDAGGGLTEFYLKIEYGSGTGVALAPNIFLTIGWATDGAGNLTGVTSSRVSSYGGAGNAYSASTFWCNLSAAPGRAQVMMFTGTGITSYSSTTVSFGFSIERLRNASFEQTNDILFLMWRNGLSSQMGVFNQVISPTLAYSELVASVSGATATLPLAACVHPANAVVSGECGVSLIFGQKGGLTAPSANIFGGSAANFGVAQTNDVKVTTYGVERNYIINGSTPFFAPFQVSSQPILILSRFE